ncbi:AAA family ATPase [Geothrix sp. 21YS21S-2]|uniref:AAA family ATPase n=1 Tax=Geothrix sp. 21YS21S-2 TaxID=3068893 RepID=UPI0027B97C82|nr:AAA family ATPase [Geothrix sp. 21YS21S-2]
MPSFRFERVDLDAFRGFAGMGFTVERLAPGIVVVHGPNGAGKSSLVQAMELLLWDQAKAPEGTILHAQVRLGDLSQERSRLQDRLVAKAGALPAQPSPWSGASTRERYRLSLSDLLQSREANQAFGEQLRQEMQGGVDFQKHRADLKPLAAFSRRAGATEAFEQARAALQEKSREQGAQESLEEEIRALEAEAATLDAHADRERALAALDQALESLETLLAQDAALEPFQARETLLAGLREPDETAFRDLRASRDAAATQVASLQDQLEKVDGGLAPLDLPPGLRKDHAEAARNLAGALKDAQTEARDRGRAHREAAAALDDWRQANPWLGAPVDQLPSLSPDVLERTRALARKFERSQSLLHALDQVASTLGPEETALSAGTLASATLILEQWQDKRATLEALARLPDGKGRWGAFAWALMAAGLLAGAAALVLARGAPPRVLSIAAALLLLALAAIGLRTPASQAENPDALRQGLATLQDQYLALGLPGLTPAAWAPADIAVLARKVRDEAAKGTGLAKLNLTRNQVRANAETERGTWKALLAEAGDLARQLNLHPEPTDAFGGYLEILARRLEQGLALRGTVATAGELEAEASRQLASLLAKAATLLEAFRRTPGPDPAAALAVLADDLDTALRLHGERLTLVKTLDALGRSSPQADLDAFLAARGLAEHTFQEAWDTRRLWHPLMTARLGQLSLVETLFKRDGHWTPEFQAIADRREAPLADRRDRLARARAQVRTDLAAARETLRKIAAAREAALLKQATLTRLTGETTLAALILARDQAAQRLEDQRIRDLEGRTLARLIDRLEERGADEDLKPQLRRASDLFQAFTGHRYVLRFENAAFVAREGDRTRPLDQLSEGTRLQLLMAVRLAYVEHQEGPDGIQLPLFLDEVLANSDDTRAQAILEAIQVMAGTGRQIFYFTAQQDEVAKWRRLGPRGIQILDLAEVRNLGARRLAPLPAVDLTRPPIPDPGEDSLLGYARRLGAAGPSLWTPLSQQHAWLAFAEGQQRSLHLLLQGGFETVGQVRNFLGTPITPEKVALLTTIEILEQAQAALQAARPRPLSPAIIEAAEIPRFGDMAGVAAVFRECGNDPRALLDSVIPGVGPARKESLRDWLQKGGYLVDAEEPAEEILARLKGRYASRLGLEERGWSAVERFLLAQSPHREAGAP